MPIMKIEPLYTAVATAAGDGRNGHVTSEDGIIDMDVRVPKELGGAGGATNPEQLFAAGYSACFHSAMRTVASREKLDIGETEVSASVGIGATDDGRFGIVVELDVHVPGLDREAAEALVARAHEVCPYSNATRDNIEVKLAIV
jgi:osmotically inducible protein OsmC